MAKKRILFLSNSYPHTVSGVTTVVENILDNFSQDFDLGIICPNNNLREKHQTIKGIKHYFLPSYPTIIRKDAQFITPNPIKLNSVFDDFSPDLVHLHDPSPASIIIKERSLENNIPVIFSHHFTSQMVLGYLPKIIKKSAQNNDNLNASILQLTCNLYQGAKRIIVPTQTMKKSLSSYTDIKISVISSGIDFDLLQNKDFAKISAASQKYNLPNSPMVLHVGRLDPEKNLELLINSWGKVIKQLPNLHLVIVGTGSRANKLRLLAEDLGISDSIIWTGLIPSQDLPFIYQNPQTKLFAIPSPIESQSIVTLMAAATKLPIVAVNSGAIPEIVKENKNGYLCSASDVECFARNILRIINSQNNDFARESSKIASKHDYSLVFKKYLKLYEQTFL